MKYYIPTYEECKLLVETKGELVFYETKHIIQGYNISVFNYRLANYMDFIEPIKDKTLNAREIRGICFVFDVDGSYKTFLMLNKFWNINQVTETLLPNLKEKKIKYIHTKYDGTLISFIKLPNNFIIPKSKMGFDNEMCLEVNDICSKNNSILKFVKECFENNYSTMWEYVSFKNKIVINYNESNLVLLRVRNNTTGEYIDINSFKNKGFDVAESENFKDLDELIEFCKDAKEIEGFVITFDDNYMVKCKTNYYFMLHKLITEDLNHENVVIKYFLTNTLDDLISQLPVEQNQDKINWINNITDKVTKYIRDTILFIEPYSIEYNSLVEKYFNELKSKYDITLFLNTDEENIIVNENLLISAKKLSTKDFAIKYKKNKMFTFIINIICNQKDKYKVIEEFILRNSKNLMEARDFLKSIEL
jgi:T4 RnlA family RNA ligase